MKLASYSRRKCSKAEWLGELPEHWRVARCREVFRERKEFSTTGEEQLLSVSEYYGVKPRSEVIDEGDFLTRADTLEGYRKCHRHDLVMNYMLAWKSGLGCTEFDGIVSPAYAVFEVRKPEFHYRYYHYLLRTPPAAAEFRRFSYGIIDSRLRLYPSTFLSAICVSVPPLDEQRAIADFLDRETARLDMLVGKKRELIEKLKEKRTALISRTVARGLNPNAKLKSSEVEWLGDIPQHWEVKPIKLVARVGNGSTPNRDNTDYWEDDGYPWLNSSVVNKERVEDADQFVTELALAECHLPRIKPPAVLIGITGEGRTRGMATTLMIEATINQHIAFVQPRSNGAEVRYLRRVFDMGYVFLRSESAGGGSTKGAITCEQISSLKIPVPQLPEQCAIAEYLDRETAKIDKMIEKVEAAIEKLQEYRIALITAAVTGKIDVRGEANSVGSTGALAAGTLPA